MGRQILLFVLFMFIVGCEDSITLKEYLFKNTDTKIQIDNGKEYDKYLDIESSELKKTNGKILTINKGGDKQEILLSKKWQKIQESNYFVKAKG